MDELQISGKRYIASRRIAKENGYHSDYIGQLIRANKIKGQKVGRTWYVEAGSFDAYLGQEAAPKQEQVAEVAAPEVAQPEPAVVPAAVSKINTEDTVPTPEPAALVATTVAHTTSALAEQPETKEEKEEEITFKIPLHKVAAEHSSGLRYIADEEPLLPEIPRSERVTRVMPSAASIEEEGAETAASVAAIDTPAARPYRTLTLLAVVGVAVFVFSAVMSSTLLQTINIEAGNPASVGYMLQW